MKADPRAAWREFEAEAMELIAQADRRLARPGATKALRYCRDKCARDLEATRRWLERGDFGGRDPLELIAVQRHWFNELAQLEQS